MARPKYIKPYFLEDPETGELSHTLLDISFFYLSPSERNDAFDKIRDYLESREIQ